MTVFWSAMTKDIEETVSSCEKCMKYQSKQPKEPMQTRYVPLLPWQTVASDILEHKIKTILWSLIIIQSTLRHSNSRVKQVKMLFRVLMKYFPRTDTPKH